MEKLIVIDGNSLINRAFYAMPLLTNSEGIYLNAVYGFANMLCKIITDYKPTQIAVCFDAGKPTFRHLQNKDYKANRHGMPTELKEQIPMLKELLTKMNIRYIEQEGFEGDDLVGSICKKFSCEKIIISGDKDLFQLIDDNTTVFHTKKGITEYLEVNRETLMETMEITPEQVVELKALMGDTSDNIKGIAGIGPKTALNLIKEYGNIDNLYNHIEEVKGKIKEKLEQGKEDAFESRWLAQIKTDVEIKEELTDFNYTFPFTNDAYNLMKRFEFNSIIRRSTLFNLEENVTVESLIDTEITKIKDVENLKNIAESIRKNHFVVLDINKNINIYTNQKEYLIEIKEDFLSEGIYLDEFLDIFKDILESEEILKTVYDSKDLKHKLYNSGHKLGGVIFDVSLSEYLVKCGMKIADNLEELLEQNGINKQAKGFGLYKLSEKFTEELKNLDMYELYRYVEFPLVDCLFNMEITGVKLDKDELERLKKDFSEQIQKISEEIYALADKKFNINSPKQLGEILFVDLGLQNTKKGSTANEVLVKLINQHPIIDKIIQYRKIFKISGYVDAFLEKMDKKDNKLHTIYQQKLTTTGRLSSIEPNLQNVPVRDEIGKNLRKAFISSFEDGVLISSDYSQIELKLLANFSKDEKMIDAYKNGVDIHTKTASEIFGIPQEFITPDMRKKAKAINFGIIYGISDYGLSESIHSSIKEANTYMKNYFDAFPKIKVYLDGLVDLATQKGYSETICHRRRKIPELSSSNHNQKLFGKRVSMNMPLQGSASDIIKIAMNNVFGELNKRNLKSKLILQIHDELIVDCPKDEIEEVKAILKNCMENVINLEIPLICDIVYGKNWFEAL